MIHNRLLPQTQHGALFSYLLFWLPSNLKSSTIPFNQLHTGSARPQAPGMRTTDFSSPDISWPVQE